MEPPRDGKEGRGPAPPDAAGEPFVVASHRVLFAEPEHAACDACGAALPHAGADEGGYRVAGEGVYMWTRGEQVRFDRAPLCPECASAIGMTALARWEIEEEEG
jgi:hypothetical protein